MESTSFEMKRASSNLNPKGEEQVEGNTNQKKSIKNMIETVLNMMDEQLQQCEFMTMLTKFRWNNEVHQLNKLASNYVYKEEKQYVTQLLTFIDDLRKSEHLAYNKEFLRLVIPMMLNKFIPLKNKLNQLKSENKDIKPTEEKINQEFKLIINSLEREWKIEQEFNTLNHTDNTEEEYRSLLKKKSERDLEKLDLQVEKTLRDMDDNLELKIEYLTILMICQYTYSLIMSSQSIYTENDYDYTRNTYRFARKTIFLHITKLFMQNFNEIDENGLINQSAIEQRTEQIYNLVKQITERFTAEFKMFKEFFFTKNLERNEKFKAKSKIYQQIYFFKSLKSLWTDDFWNVGTFINIEDNQFSFSVGTNEIRLIFPNEDENLFIINSRSFAGKKHGYEENNLKTLEMLRNQKLDKNPMFYRIEALEKGQIQRIFKVIGDQLNRLIDQDPKQTIRENTSIYI